MSQKYTVKHYKDLTTAELYDLLRLRNEVFIVEQNCSYLDLDNKDQQCYHVLYYLDDQLAGYTRLLPSGLSFNDVAIGRVVVSPLHRGTGLGKKLMEASINCCYDKFGHSSIRISAQKRLLKFYQTLGFKAEGEPYYEDGILHVEMVKIKIIL
ncbi:MAG: GNAT family N-acetyltransferase [Chitinophagaceae bacterium]|nr:MAG: GNAT family N-acetyltransferase [Chitinophagaceae bacterium]